MLAPQAITRLGTHALSWPGEAAKSKLYMQSGRTALRCSKTLLNQLLTRQISIAPIVTRGWNTQLIFSVSVNISSRTRVVCCDKWIW